ncbi:hypothetical protein T439DRAFT_321438 [Meredithblackwellia eburnea MCA 4105]
MFQTMVLDEEEFESNLRYAINLRFEVHKLAIAPFASQQAQITANHSSSIDNLVREYKHSRRPDTTRTVVELFVMLHREQCPEIQQLRGGSNNTGSIWDPVPEASRGNRTHVSELPALTDASSPLHELHGGDGQIPHELMAQYHNGELPVSGRAQNPRHVFDPAFVQRQWQQIHELHGQSQSHELSAREIQAHELAAAHSEPERPSAYAPGPRDTSGSGRSFSQSNRGGRQW